MGDFQEDNFQQKLLLLKDTQDSIQSLSVWCLKHQQQHKKVVSCWLHVLKKVKVEQRLSLFYLANDVIQYSKRKNYPFVESWAPALQKATPLVRDDKVRHKILRLFKIWNERNVYDETFLTDLSGLLTAHTKKSKQVSAADLIQEFQPTLLFSKIRKCKTLEEDTDLKLKVLKECTIPVSDPDALRIVVKDRRNGDDLLLDLDDGIQKLEAYTKALELEIKERNEVINVLEVSEQFYDTQRGEAKVVCNAYRNFGNRVKTLKRKLEELLPTLPSPVPSPDVNAPSPSSGSDIDIPEDNNAVHYDSEKSFIGTDFVTAMSNANEKQTDMMNADSSPYNYQNLDMGTADYGMHAVQTNYEDYSINGRDPNSVVSAGYYKNNSQLDMESPASPVHRGLNNDSYLYHSEGNRIEVISSSNKSNDNHGGGGDSFGVSGFLQSIMTTNSTGPTPVPPVPAKIPGLESPTDNARQVFDFIESKVKVVEAAGPIMWGDKPLTKYQSWPSPDITWTNPQETPVSPPAFEQESFSNPVEYVDSNVFSSMPPPSFNNSGGGGLHHRLADIDHRLLVTSAAKTNDNCQNEFDQLATIPLPKHDVDDRLQNALPNRNLISLTESPSSLNDSDYRVAPLLSTPAATIPSLVDGVRKTPQDNIESVDMEMSDDECDSKPDEQRVRHRKASSFFKDEQQLQPQQQPPPPSQLLPPPNPWDMVNLSMDNTSERANSNNKNNNNVSNKTEFDKMMSFFANTPPNMEAPEFAAARFAVRAPNLSIPPPSGGDPKMFAGSAPPPPPPPSISNLPNRMTAPFNGPPPFGFVPPFTNSNPSALFAANDQRSPPIKELPPPLLLPPPPFQPSEPPPDFQLSAPPPGYEPTAAAGNVNNIEPLIKMRQFDKRLPEENVVEYVAAKPIRSNLKEISLSDVLEKSMARSIREEELVQEEQEKKKISDSKRNDDANDAVAEDLFGEESVTVAAAGDNVDDGDDLYNNIEETSAESESNSRKTNTSDAAEHLDHHHHDAAFKTTTTTNDSKSPRKTRFQGVVPKASKPPMAAPNFIDDDDQRSPWPLMPVIDLSDENNVSHDFADSDDIEQGGSGGGGSDDDEEHAAVFTTQDDGDGGERGGDFYGRGGTKNDFRSRPFNHFGNDRRFSSPQQSPMRFRGGRFMSPRADFRQRMGGGNNFSPNQELMRRMPRGPFGSPNVRPNFQNSPRMFKTVRPGRPFRRGW